MSNEKFGVCAVVRMENLYLDEWIHHYLELGFDKIIIYDNKLKKRQQEKLLSSLVYHRQR